MLATETKVLDEALAVLPAWAPWGHLVFWTAIILVCVILGRVTAALLQPLRDTPDQHWTERARLLWPRRQFFGMTTLIQLLTFGVVAWYLPTGLSSLGQFSFTVVMLVIIYVADTRWVWRLERRAVGDWLTLGFFVRSYIQQLLIFRLAFVIAIVFGLGMPVDLGWQLWVTFGVGAVLMFATFAGAGLQLARLIGLVKPAGTRLQTLVDRAAAQVGVTPRGTFELDAYAANAFALPVTKQLAFTRRALEVMDDGELLAICHHELGHLRESKAVLAARILPITLLLVLMATRPLLHHGGYSAFLIAFGAALVIAVLVARRMQKWEHAADAHAHEHEPEEDKGRYARALEKLYESNLAPAVQAGKTKSHPDLYDRMVEAGVQPDYERPEQPPNAKWRKAVLTVVLLGMFIGAFFGNQLYHPLRGGSSKEFALLWEGPRISILLDIAFEDECPAADRHKLLQAVLWFHPWDVRSRIADARALRELGREDDAKEQIRRARKEFEQWPEHHQDNETRGQIITAEKEFDLR